MGLVGVVQDVDEHDDVLAVTGERDLAAVKMPDGDVGLRPGHNVDP